MKHTFLRFTALALILIGGVFVPAMKADEWNKKTNITISQPIEIQGTVLPTGSYVIKLLNTPERHVVQIFNAEENHIITTIFAIPTYRSRPADNTELKFYQFENGQPAALHTWFYPGDSAGFEFSPGRKGVEAARSTVDTASSSRGGN